MLSAKQAAEATGVSKQAILRAIKRGTISASKDIRGEWTIDAAELFRHYQPLPVVHTNDTVGDASVHTPDTAQVDILRAQVVMLERIIATKDDVIQDLRRRLDAQADQAQQLTAMLAALTPPQPAAPRSWWARLLGG